MCGGDPPVREDRGLSPSHSSASLPNRQSSDIAVGCSCVDYDEVVAAFFHPSPKGMVPSTVAGASPARRLQRRRADRHARRLVTSDERTAGRPRTRLPRWLRLGTGSRARRAGRWRGRVVVRGVRTGDAGGGLRAGPDFLLAATISWRRGSSRPSRACTMYSAAMTSRRSPRGWPARSGASPRKTSPGDRCSLGWRVSRGPRTRMDGCGVHASCYASTAATVTSRSALRPGSVRWR